MWPASGACLLCPVLLATRTRALFSLSKVPFGREPAPVACALVGGRAHVQMVPLVGGWAKHNRNYNTADGLLPRPHHEVSLLLPVYLKLILNVLSMLPQVSSTGVLSANGGPIKCQNQSVVPFYSARLVLCCALFGWCVSTNVYKSRKRI